MKLSLSFLTFLFLAGFVQAKKVKFSVDMTGTALNTGGMHITGDFQSEAGLGADFASLIPLTQEGTSMIYSITVDIPAFRKYEYKFANGKFFYDVEFVPVESRVGYNSVDNRWIYVDSLTADTFKIPAVLYAGNAPQGMYLLRPLVDMSSEASVSSSGVHLAGDWQSWNTTSDIMYSFGSGIYETLAYVSAGTRSYKFYNGNSTASSEAVPASCAVAGYRQIVVNTDLALTDVCFSQCASCSATSVRDQLKKNAVQLFPNPAMQSTELIFAEPASTTSVVLTDITGKLLREYHGVNSRLIIERGDLTNGLYYIKLLNGTETRTTLKLLFN
ncbi:MAG TPA: T9SS type A sorting domain-containing protein [Flavipsychrobacter sp.]|nr:T9SS type A sorting domain-containing protein [Flavipsychrobacter sp.]